MVATGADPALRWPLLVVSRVGSLAAAENVRTLREGGALRSPALSGLLPGAALGGSFALLWCSS